MLWLLFVLICGLLSDTTSSVSCGCKGKNPKSKFRIQPDENGLIEGDILLSPEQLSQLRFRQKWEMKPLEIEIKLWDGGVVPYEVLPYYYTFLRPILLPKVERALQEISKATDGCVKFRKKNESDPHFVRVMYGNSCHSRFGRRYGAQVVSLHRSCFKEAIIQHEFIHALGFGHEHNRSDRDYHLIVHYDNIMTSQCDQFRRWKSMATYCYDSESVMHYPGNVLSCNGKPTLTRTNGRLIGNYVRNLTKLDALKIKKLYGCK